MIRHLLKVKVKIPLAEKLSLVNAYNEQCFWVYNGATLSNLKDLLRALKIMSKAQFDHHVTLEKNDFAQWVRDILKDADCAAALEKCGAVKKAIGVVERRLEDYKV